MAFPTTAVKSTLKNETSYTIFNADPLNQGRDTLPQSDANGFYKPSSFNEWEVWYNPSTYGPDSECYVTVANRTGSEVTRVGCRLTDPAGSSNTGDGYFFYAVGTSGRFYRFNNSSGVALGSGAFTISASATAFGIEVTGTGATVTLKAYQMVSGVWSLVATETDTSGSRLTSAGYLFIEGEDSTGNVRWSDLGGGTLVPSQTIAIGQVTSTTTAQPISPPASQTVTVGQVTCSTTAQPVTYTGPQTATVGQVTSTTTARPVTSTQSSNTQAQGGLAWLFHRGKIPGLGGVIGQVQTTTTARGISSRQTVGQASSTTLARPVILAGSVTIRVKRDTAGRLLTGKPSPGRLLTGKTVSGRLLDRNTV